MTEKRNFIMYRLILFGLILGLSFNLLTEVSEADNQRSGLILNEAACAMINDGHEPPKNLFLADSLWPMSHRNPYQQASSPYPGPYKTMSQDHFTFLKGLPGVITIAFSGKYPDGSRAIWCSNQRVVFKARFEDKRLVDVAKIKKEGFSWVDIINPDVGISGAYVILDKDNTFFVPRFNKLYAYGDDVQGDPDSSIRLKGSFEIPKDELIDEEEIIIGINLTYDGMIALVTNKGLVCVVSRTFDEVHYFRFGKDEEISNSIAIDEDNGIYVVTSKKMYRVQWTGEKLTINEREGGWSADYEVGSDIAGVRLGVGSGSTPTLMGTGQQDKFVVITDGQRLMNIVLFWREKIPADWKQISGTKDRRIAAQTSITFGNREAKKSSSEQSVCIRGYGALVVNNELNIDTDKRVWAIIRSGDPDVAPYGAEKFVWNPAKRELKSVWSNKEISFPNGIPCMSAATNLIYDVGQRNGTWTFEALDWDTGKSMFHYGIGKRFWYNSTWAATAIGPYGTINSGAFLGIMSAFPDK